MNNYARIIGGYVNISIFSKMTSSDLNFIKLVGHSVIYVKLGVSYAPSDLIVCRNKR